MSDKLYTDRSRQITGIECPRRRYLTYEMGGTGFTKIRNSIPLLTGTVVHTGLACMRRDVMEAKHKGVERVLVSQYVDIDKAVRLALKEYQDELSRRGLDVELGEDAEYTAKEQMALCEALLRVYWMLDDGLQSLVDRYDIIEVEHDETYHTFSSLEDGTSIDMNAKADALLMEHGTHDLYIASDKTIGQMDYRKENENRHDVQGLSEAFIVEKRLREWWRTLKDNGISIANPEALNVKALSTMPDLPRIMGIQMTFLVKGRREQDNYDGKWKTRNRLLYGWAKPGIAGEEFAWTYNWSGPDVNETTGKLVGHKLGKGWRMFPTFEAVGGVKTWIDLLASGTVQPDAGNPFDGLVYTPIPYFRQDRDMQDWYEQTFALEQDWQMRVRTVEKVRNEQPQFYRQILNSLIYQNRSSCDWPSKCPCQEICFGDDSMLVNPVASGLYQIREPHHLAEAGVRKVVPIGGK